MCAYPTMEEFAPQPIVPPPVLGQPGVPQGIPIVLPNMPFSNGIEMLNRIESAVISQAPQYLETFCPCEFENEYNIYAGDRKNPNAKMDEGNKIFSCKEHSTCFQRYCCTADSREFNVELCFKEMNYNPTAGNYSTEWKPFVKMYRPYKCTCCCLARPEVEVTYIENGQKRRLGRILNNFTCCDYSFKIYEGDSTSHLYRVNASCCQCGIICKCPCKPCREVDFELYGNNKGKEELIGSIRKVWGGLIKELFSNASNFTILFPNNSTWEQKALLLCTMMFIDFRYFENSEHEDKNRVH